MLLFGAILAERQLFAIVFTWRLENVKNQSVQAIYAHFLKMSFHLLEKVGKLLLNAICLVNNIDKVITKLKHNH